MKVEHFKKWLRRLALLGFNVAKLYTEDTYELPGEPYFGYCRGAYTADELREIAYLLNRDRTADSEVIGKLRRMANLSEKAMKAATGDTDD